jgi:8-amino-7-oxononanoate synthase
LVEHFGVDSAVPLRIGTLSKALGSLGGFAVGPTHAIEWLAHKARSYFFSTAPPDVLVEVSRSALRRVQEQPWRRQELLERAARFRAQLLASGFRIGNCTSQIIPVILGVAGATMDACNRLSDAGFLVPGIRPPSVPEGESLLRISLSWAHSEQQLQALFDALQAALK